MMEYTKYLVRVIIPDGKGKTVVEETYEAMSYLTNVNNNLILEDEFGNTVIEFHSYNWLSIKPVDTAVASPEGS